jgi:hypothetical protein
MIKPSRSSAQWIRKALLLLRLVASLVARQKSSKISPIITRSSVIGERKMTTSSAYNETLCLIECDRRGLSRPLELVSLIMALKHSITRTNNIGGKGSPCISPRPWQIRQPRTPFRRILVLVVEGMIEM